MGVDEFSRAHWPAARELHTQEPEYACTGGDVDAIAPDADDFSRPLRACRIEWDGFPDSQLLPVPGGFRDRPRIERPHEPIELDCTLRPVDGGFLLPDLRCVGHTF